MSVIDCSATCEPAEPAHPAFRPVGLEAPTGGRAIRSVSPALVPALVPVLVTLLVLAMVLATGCATSRQVRSVSQAVRAELPGVELDREVHLRLGPISLGLIRGIAGLAGDDLDDEDARMLAALRRVEIDVYEIRDRDAGELEPEAVLAAEGSPQLIAPPRLARLEQQLLDQGWSPVVTIREDGELSMIMTQEDRHGQIRGMFIVSYDGDELAVVRLEGRLDRLLAEAIAADPDAFIDIIADEAELPG